MPTPVLHNYGFLQRAHIGNSPTAYTTGVAMLAQAILAQGEPLGFGNGETAEEKSVNFNGHGTVLICVVFCR